MKSWIKKYNIEFLTLTNVLISVVLWFIIYIFRNNQNNILSNIMSMNIIVSMIILPVFIGVIFIKYSQRLLDKYIENKYIKKMIELILFAITAGMSVIASFTIFSTIAILMFPE